MAQAGSFVPPRAPKSLSSIASMLNYNRTRPVDVHGRDAGKRQNSTARRRAASSCSTNCAARSAFDRPQHCVGKSEVSRNQPAEPAEDALASRLITSRRRRVAVANVYWRARRSGNMISSFCTKLPGTGRTWSYGIQVARLQALPRPSSHARAMPSALERDELARGGRPSISVYIRRSCSSSSGCSTLNACASGDAASRTGPGTSIPMRHCCRCVSPLAELKKDLGLTAIGCCCAAPHFWPRQPDPATAAQMPPNCTSVAENSHPAGYATILVVACAYQLLVPTC